MSDAMEGVVIERAPEGEKIDFFSLPQLNMPFLTSLDLSRNQWTKIPSSLSSLVALEELRLHDNQITEFPAELCFLPNLGYLDLHNNHLRDLPPQISNLHKLRWFDLAKNRLANLPIEFTELDLANLRWDSNPLHKLASEDILPERREELTAWLRYRVHARWVLNYFALGLNCSLSSLFAISVALHDTRFDTKKKL